MEAGVDLDIPRPGSNAWAGTGGGRSGSGSKSIRFGIDDVVWASPSCRLSMDFCMEDLEDAGYK